MEHDEHAETVEPASGGAAELEEALMETPSVVEESPAWGWSVPAKLALVTAGVVLPCICFLVVAFSNLFSPSWQSGQLGTYASLLLRIPSSAVFFPLLLYCMVSMVAMVFWPAENLKRFWIRFGIYSGVVLTIQYHLMLTATLSDEDIEASMIFFIASPIVAILIFAIFWFTKVTICNESPRKVAIAITVLFYVGSAVMIVLLNALLLIIPFFCATNWAIMAYGTMTWHILRRRRASRWQFSLAQLLAVVGWVAAYCSAWRWSVNLMLAEYAKLPTDPPQDCYVATAAARGHRRWVGSRPVEGTSGRTVWVNDQMRYLKAAELMLKVTCPAMHRWCRAVYDWLGPRIAARLAWPVLADIAYLMLKPAEWIARGMLVIALPERGKAIRRLYGSPRRR